MPTSESLTTASMPRSRRRCQALCAACIYGFPYSATTPDVSVPCWGSAHHRCSPISMYAYLTRGQPMKYLPE